MRDIKSRAWIKPKGIFYYNFAKVPYDVKMEGNVYRIFSGKMDKPSLLHTEFEENLFIGIQDKNKKDIYQGDICKYYNDVDKDGIGVIEDDYVKWISGTIAKTDLITPLYYLKCGVEFEVIGNIYENPELLEQGRETLHGLAS